MTVITSQPFFAYGFDKIFIVDEIHCNQIRTLVQNISHIFLEDVLMEMEVYRYRLTQKVNIYSIKCVYVQLVKIFLIGFYPVVKNILELEVDRFQDLKLPPYIL